MRRAKTDKGAIEQHGNGESDLLVDLTATLSLHSKRTERQHKRLERAKKKKENRGKIPTLLDLPYDLFMIVICHLRPSDIFNLARANKSLHQFVVQEEETITKAIVSWRYPILEKCFRVPVLIENVDPKIYPALQFEGRQEIMTIRKRSMWHIKEADPTLVCTCLTCVLRWNAMNMIVDFAYWQKNLDTGEPIPIIQRGKYPKWNTKLTTKHSSVIEKALRSPLWHARILEAHLKSTVGSITRHTNNKGNKRSRFRMTAEDVSSGTDAFLGRSGPPSMDFPFHRDNYYMLEAYFPNRSWNTEQERWMYMPASQHDTDLGYVERWDVFVRARHEQQKVASREGEELPPPPQESGKLLGDGVHNLKIGSTN